MPEHEVRGDRAVYDHETEDPRGTRRRRQVADWGVGDELFDRMPSPRRRFSAAEAPRRDAHSRGRHPADPAGPEAAPPASPAPARRLDDEPHTPAPAPAPAARAEVVPRGGVDGRRTVVIGRQSQAPARRERPARTVGERVGPRPDRLAAYAVALGLLLIIIAFLSS